MRSDRNCESQTVPVALRRLSYHAGEELTLRHRTSVPVLLATFCVFSALAASQERIIITSRVPRAESCTPETPSPDTSAETYSAYASCVLDHYAGAFNSLYTRHLRSFPDDKFDVVIMFKVGVDGYAHDVSSTTEKIVDADFLKKLAARLQVIRFAPPANTENELSYTFQFSELPP